LYLKINKETTHQQNKYASKWYRITDFIIFNWMSQTRVDECIVLSA